VTNTFTEIVYQGGNATGNLTPDRNNGTIQKFTLTGSITLNPPANMTAGQSLTLILTQDSAGNRTYVTDNGEITGDVPVWYDNPRPFKTFGLSSAEIDITIEGAGDKNAKARLFGGPRNGDHLQYAARQ
jgi:hypothetical protein